MNPRTYSWPEGHWDWYRHLAFKHGVRCGGFAFLGGQVDKDSTGEPQRVGDLPAQTEVVIGHIERVLAEFGSGLEDVVSLIAYHAAPRAVRARSWPTSAVTWRKSDRCRLAGVRCSPSYPCPVWRCPE